MIATFALTLSLIAIVFAAINFSWHYHERRACERHIQFLEKRAAQRENVIAALNQRLKRELNVSDAP